MDAPNRQGSEGLLADRGLRALFDHFPLALALTGPGRGRRIVNARFDAMLDPSCLDLPAVAAILAAPGAPPQRLALRSPAGATLQASVHALPAPDGVMLVVDDAPARELEGELAELRARIAELELLSSTDRLTGAWNRAHLDRVIGTELGRSLRFRQPISLILLDLDHFKDVNDTHGHAAGDAVLRELVAVLRGTVRSADLVFRWGGEEFVVLATNASYRSAAGLAEKLRGAVARHAFPHVGSITASGGVAEHVAGESAEAWFGRVDAVLYEAKSGGRNRICVDRRGSSDLWSGVGGRSVLRLTWLEEYECGEPTIDRQHREMFDLANALLDATAGEGGRSGAVKEAFARLVAHVDGHFRDEEILLEKAGYPQLKAHAQAHARLRKRAFELQEAADAGRIPFGPVVDFLANEIVARHLFTADRDFYPLFAGGFASA